MLLTVVKIMAPADFDLSWKVVLFQIGTRGNLATSLLKPIFKEELV